MLASWTQQTQLSPTFIQHSFEQSVQLSYQVLSFENSRWAGLGRILGYCLRNHRKTPVSSVYRCLFPREGFPGQTYKKQVVWKHECKHGSSLECCITNILRQPSEELVPWELTPWHWSKQVKFRPSWLFHFDSLRTAVKLQCCHMLASWTQQTQLSPTFIQHSFEQSVQLSYQVLSFENSHWAGLGRILGRCLRNHRKTLVSSVYRCLFPREGFPRQTYIKQVGWKHGCNAWIILRVLYHKYFASAFGGACAMGTNTMALIQTSYKFRHIQAIMTVLQRLSLSAQLMRCNVST